MNQLVPTDQTSTREIGFARGASGSSIAPQNLGEVVRFAEVMCRADIALPKHLRGNAGACMAVAMQALEWQMSPFAVASKSYEVGGRIAYEAQLIAAVVNTRSGIKGRLKYFFEGEGPALTCRVVGILDGEECEYDSPTVGSITVKNSPLWKSDPQQQLGYFSARSWARRHCPEVILGVYDRDEVEQFRSSENARDVTPSLSERLAISKVEQHTASPAREGFDPSFVARETAALSGEATAEQETANHEPSSAALQSADDGGSDQATSPGQVAADESASQVDAEAGDIEAQESPGASSASEPIDPVKRMLMEECADNMLRDAFSVPSDQAEAKIEKLRLVFLENQNLGEFPDFVNRCAITATRVIGKPAEKARARDYLIGRIPT